MDECHPSDAYEEWERHILKTWRWLDAIDDRQPPEEQPPFNSSGEPICLTQYQPYRKPILNSNDVPHLPVQCRPYRFNMLPKNQQRSALQLAEQEESRMLQLPVQDDMSLILPQKPSPSYGAVKILRRSPAPGSGDEPCTDLRTRFETGQSSAERTPPPTSFDYESHEVTRQSISDQPFGERATNLGNHATLHSRFTEGSESNGPVDIDNTIKRVSQWARIRANSKTATQMLFRPRK